MTSPGLDVSNNNGPVNWTAVAEAGYRFGFCKASESNWFADAYLTQNFIGMQQNGLARGAYHFAQPDENPDPRADAQHFCDVVEHLLLPGDITVLDIETGSGNLLSWVQGWLQHTTMILGFRPILYSGGWFMRPHGLEDPSLGEYGLWYAAYQTLPPPAPPGWDFIAFWQHDDRGHVPGVSGNCDLDTFMGGEDRIRLYGKPADAPEPDWRAVVADAADKVDAASAALRGLLPAAARRRIV